jgi:hypothetical protein
MIEGNHARLQAKLKKRGWDTHYVRKTVQMLKGRKAHPLDRHMFWIYLVVFEICTLIVFFGTLPMLALLPNLYSIAAISLLGMSLGFLSEHIFLHYELDKKHYSSLVVLLVANIFIYLFIFNSTKLLLVRYGLFIDANPLAMISFYTLGYLLPHIFHKSGIRK